MIKRNMILGGLAIFWLFLISSLPAQDPADGENEYRLATVNPRATTNDTLTGDAGRGVWVADSPDLDGDGLPEILVTEYTKGGRVFVFEVVGDDKLEFVWSSKRLAEDREGGQSTPRTVTTGDFDNNGRQEIIFPIGYFANDSAEAADRGIYFYEHDGVPGSNNYGSEPTYKMTFEFIDPAYASVNTGTYENGLLIRDVDGDGKNEFLIAPRSSQGLFSTEVLKMYILEVEEGSLAGGDAVIDHEYVYEAMSDVSFLDNDGYMPLGLDVGDVDVDGLDEIAVFGWRNIGSGIGLGFIEISDVDTYTPGSIIPIWDEGTCCVKTKPLIVQYNDRTAIYMHRTSGSGDRLWVVEGIISDQFVSESNVTELFADVGIFSIWDWGDQDHPTEGDPDGFDLYLSQGTVMLDIEYDGSGELTNPNSYTITPMYNLAAVYDSTGGLFNDVFTYPGMDLDRDGRRDVVASWKGSGIDSLKGELLDVNGFHIFLFEWGDSLQSTELPPVVGLKPTEMTIITPEDYQLLQNYPNPFNPSTTIEFVLPLSKSIELKIYNSLGQEVRTLIDKQRYSEGRHSLQWDGRDNSGNPVSSGVYVYKLTFGNFSKSKKMTLLR